jgi:hypothetical protein
MGTQRTAPEGYPSNFSAILDVLRFGFSIWPPTRKAALLFHIERSTAYGWAADQHSRSQALTGIYSAAQRKWIRGPAGISESQWKRENRALEKAGIIQRTRRSTAKGGHAASEYAPDWPAIKAAIEQWKEAQPNHNRVFPLGPVGPSPWVPGALPLGPAGPSPWAPGAHTVVKSGDLTLVSESPTHPPGGLAVAAALEAAYGAALQRNDPIPGEILAIADRLAIPTAALCRWISELGQEKRKAGYPITSPRLWLTAARTNLIPWARHNGELIASARRAEQLASRAAAPSSLGELPKWIKCEKCGADIIDGGAPCITCAEAQRKEEADATSENSSKTASPAKASGRRRSS